MAFADPKRTENAAHKYTFRVCAIEGTTVRILWEGDKFGEGEAVAEAAAVKARSIGSLETIVMDGFRLSIERQWAQRLFTSRAPSVTPIRRELGKKGRPKILFLPLEFPSWLAGGHSWSYAASLAYGRALTAAGCEVTTVNTACAPIQRKVLRESRFDQVWFHCHPRHLTDFAFRQWMSDIAPVRVMLCGESLSYPLAQREAEPWTTGHVRTAELWRPHVTHAAVVDPADVGAEILGGLPTMHWQQAVPRDFVLPVNERPKLDTALFLGTLYPPRDRWAWELDGLLSRLNSPESDAFTWAFEKSHEWIQQAFDRTGQRSPWWRNLALGAYNRFQDGLRRHAFGNFLGALRQGVATVSLPSMVKTYSGRVVEGMAVGRPVITQRIPGHPAVFQPNELLHYETAAELGDHIRRLQREPKTAIDIAKNARDALLAFHTVEKRTAELLAFVEGG